MAKLFVLYDQPKDKDGFEKYYQEIHMPLARKMPNVRHASIHKVVQSNNNNDNLYCIVEIEFDNEALLKDALNSEVGRRVQEDAQNLLPFLQRPPLLTITN